MNTVAENFIARLIMLLVGIPVMAVVGAVIIAFVNIVLIMLLVGVLGYTVYNALFKG